MNIAKKLAACLLLVSIVLSSAVVASAADYTTTFAHYRDNDIFIKNDGTVWITNGHASLNTYYTQIPDIRNAEHLDMSNRALGARIICSDGVVWLWTGDTATKVNKTDNIKAINHQNSQLVLNSDGSVWGKGGNTWGTITTIAGQSNKYLDDWTKVPVDNVKTLLFGDDNSTGILALTNDGTIWQWGLNGAVLAGNNIDTLHRSVVDNVTHLVVGDDKIAYALKNDGTVWAVGRYSYGHAEFSDIKLDIPTAIKELRDYVGHVIALDESGHIYSISSSDFGESFNIHHIDIPAKIKGIEPYDGGPYKRKIAVLDELGNIHLLTVGKSGISSDVYTGFNDVIAFNYSRTFGSDGLVFMKNDGSLWSWSERENDIQPYATVSDQRSVQHPVENVKMPSIITTTPISNATPPTPASNDITVVLNNTVISFEVAPQAIDGYTMLPLRDICNALGIAVDYNSTTHTAIMTKGDIVMNHVIGEKTLIINGVEHKFDASSTVVSNRTLMPVRMLAEAIGADVQWVDATRTVIINTQ